MSNPLPALDLDEFKSNDNLDQDLPTDQASFQVNLSHMQTDMLFKAEVLASF